MKKFSLKDIVIKIERLPEDIPIKGNAIASGDETIDREVEAKIESELEWNEWAWCCIKVTAHIPGIDLEGTDYLGGCSYESEKAFRECIYFEDMRHSAQADLLKQIEAIQELKLVVSA